MNGHRHSWEELALTKVIQLLPTFDNSGPSNLALALAATLRKLEFEVILCSMRSSAPHDVQRARDLDLQVIDLGMHSLIDVRTYLTLYHLIGVEKVSIVHNHGFRPEVYGGIAGRLRKVIVLATIHANLLPDLTLDYGPVNARVQIWIRRWLAHRCADALVAVSEDARMGLRQVGVKHHTIRVIHSGIQLELFAQDNRKLAQQEISRGGVCSAFRSQAIGTVAVLNQRKGLPTLIDAAPLVLQEYPAARFLIIGRGPLYEQLLDQVHRLGLEGSVSFLGGLNHADYVKFFRTLDVFVLPSLTEGLPAVVFEAMAAGLPVVATKVGGTPEVVVDGVTGILVPPSNVEALAAAICRVLRDPNLALQFGQQGSKRVQKHFTVERMAQAYAQLYRDLLAKRS